MKSLPTGSSSQTTNLTMASSGNVSENVMVSSQTGLKPEKKIKDSL